VSDTHLRVLRDLVRHRMQALKAHDARPGETAAEANSRRRDLQRLSARARTRLAAAEARRRAPREDS
jgi:hypothetical protein